MEEGIIAVIRSHRVTVHLWLHWMEIAVQHEHAAQQARAMGVAGALNAEMQASMVTVSAAAHAIDAFYGAVKNLIAVPQATQAAWRANRTPRRAQILETLRHGFVVGAASRRWEAEFDWLFDLRDATVHFRERPKTKVPHPRGTNEAPERVVYAIESAQQAVDIALDVFQTCLDNPKPGNEGLANYARGIKGIVPKLAQERITGQFMTWC